MFENTCNKHLKISWVPQWISQKLVDLGRERRLKRCQEI